MAVRGGGRHGGWVDRVRSLLVALVALVVVGCASDPAAVPPTTTTTAGTSVPTPSTTTTEVVPFETEVKQAAIDLLEVRNDVFQHPDVARVAEYIAPTCTCLERERGIVQSLIDDGLRWNAPAVLPRGLLIDDPDPTGPSLTIVAEQPATEIVGPDGAAAETVPPDDATALGVVLVRDDSGEWRINGLDRLQLNEAVIEAVVGAGLS